MPCGAVNDLREAFQLARAVGLDAVAELPGGGLAVASPISFDATPVAYRTPPPGLGADDAQVRAWLRGD